MKQIPYSVLDLAVVKQGGNIGTAIAETVATAQQAEALGYTRIWMAEHHNMEHIASSATSLLISHVAANTKSIRVGSGGIMLPNHSPLVIAEQFGTLETLYPGRIDLGLGRAPGTDQLTAMALRRNNMHMADNFPSEIAELQRYFSASNKDSKVRAFPGEGLDIPIWVLGSSTDSAYLAARLGLPYAFAAHFAPAMFRSATEIYKKQFQPSAVLAKPYMIACVNVIGGETEEEATFLATSLYRMFLGIITNMRSPLLPPEKLPAVFNHPEVRQMVDRMTSCTFTGTAATLQEQLAHFIEDTGIDELMATNYIFDGEKKLASNKILADAMNNM